jgi:hypothetical protein
MKGPDWFIVGIRLLGAWFLAQSVIYAVSFLDLHLGITPLADARITNHYAYLLYTTGYLFVALVFLVGAAYVARLCYGRMGADSDKRGVVNDGDYRFSRTNDRDDRSTH